MEKLDLEDSDSHQHHRKAKPQPAHHPCEAVAQDSSLDLNTNKEDCITVAQKTLASSFSFYNPEDHTIHFTPSIIGQTTQGTYLQGYHCIASHSLLLYLICSG